MATGPKPDPKERVVVESVVWSASGDEFLWRAGVCKLARGTEKCEEAQTMSASMNYGGDNDVRR